MTTPRKLLLDECLPRRLKRDFPGHDILTVPEMGWAGIKNGALLRLAEKEFQVFITHDSSLVHQQDISKFKIGIVAFRAISNRYEDLRPLIPQALKAVVDVQPGTAIIIQS